MPRLKSEIWIKAHIRRCQGEGAFAVIVRKGNAEAGAIAIKVYAGIGQARLLMQSMSIDGEMIWWDVFGELVEEGKVDKRLTSEADIDPDIWIIEIEGCDGYGFVEVSKSLS